MQGLYQLSRLSKNQTLQLPAIPAQRFYRLWVVEDHPTWTVGQGDQELNLTQTLWFFPKHFKPGISHHEVEGFTLWFDDLFLQHNPLLQMQPHFLNMPMYRWTFPPACPISGCLSTPCNTAPSRSVFL